MAGPVDVEIRRLYDARPTQGRTRVLVDRVWPRRLRREALALDLWLRDLGPSDELRRWFGHRPDRGDEFERRYRAELEQPRQAELLGQLARLARDGPLTLLYGARDERHNQAVVLRAVLQERLGRDQR